MKEQLTREQIHSLNPGFELDALIAVHVMGWERSEAWGGGNWVRSEDKTVMCNVIAWRPSLDLRDAWEVAEKVDPAHGYKVSKLPDKDRRVVDGNVYQCFYGSIAYCAFGKTAPEAICKAALLASLEEVTTK